MDHTLPFLIPQPRPEVTMVCHLKVAGVDVTSITRRWAPGDTRRCSLCPSFACSAYDGVCNIMVDRRVTIDDAKLYDLNGAEFVPSGLPDAADPLGAGRNKPWLEN